LHGLHNNKVYLYQKIISKFCELVKLRHINRRDTVFLRHSLYDQVV